MSEPYPASPTGGLPHPRVRGLVVDWGGVLTTGLSGSMQAWTAQEGIEFDRFVQVMGAWAVDGQAPGAPPSPIHALERAEISTAEFQQRLASALGGPGGRQVGADGLLERMFAHFRPAPAMLELVGRVHHAGLRTALLSNSWGNRYPREGWDTLFDAVVISGEVGMRKPEPRIFRHTLDLLGLVPGEVVFVDDLASNVVAAEALGMVGLRHEEYEQTARALEPLLGLGLLGPQR